MTDCTGYQKNNIHSYYDLPFLPVRLFKERDLKSIPDEQVFKVMTSSGTTGQAVSTFLYFVSPVISFTQTVYA